MRFSSPAGAAEPGGRGGGRGSDLNAKRMKRISHVCNVDEPVTAAEERTPSISPRLQTARQFSFGFVFAFFPSFLKSKVWCFHSCLGFFFFHENE